MKSGPNLSAILDPYSAIFCDVWGVIRDGHSLLDPAIEALQRARRKGVPVILVSNSPRPFSEVQRQLENMGAPDDAWDAIVTSGDATRLALNVYAPGPFFKIGPAGADDRLYDGLEIGFSGYDSARVVVCTGLVGTIGEGPEDYTRLFETLLERDLPMICANPDIVVQVGDELVWCAGALARKYRDMGGECIISGKPHKPIYDLAYKLLAEIGWQSEHSSVLAIGDGPETDLAGADRIGIDALFIADGILGQELAGEDEDRAREILTEYETSAKWFARRLVW